MNGRTDGRTNGRADRLSIKRERRLFTPTTLGGYKREPPYPQYPNKPWKTRSDMLTISYTCRKKTTTNLWLAPAAAKAGESPFFTNRSKATAFGVDWTDEQIRGSFCFFYIYIYYISRSVVANGQSSRQRDGPGAGGGGGGEGEARTG